MSTYAHFPGTGPAGRTCRECAWFDRLKAHQGKCAKWARLTGQPVKKAKLIGAVTQSCRHFEERDDENERATR